MSKFETYEHHGQIVWVNQDLKGKHRDHCLCYKCSKFNPDDRDNNCTIANTLYQLCIMFTIVTPVYECKEFNPTENEGD